MTGFYDPISLALLQSLGTLAQNVGAGVAEGYQETQQERLGLQAIQKYVQDPSPANFLAASKFVDMEKAIKASKEISTEAGLEQLAEMWGISPDVARLLVSNNKLLDMFTPTTGPLGHLSPEEIKRYQSLQQERQEHAQRSSLARQMRLTGSRAALSQYTALTGASATDVKRLKKKTDISEFGRQIELSELAHGVRKQIEEKLLEKPNLTPQQRSAIQTEILSSPKFAKFLHTQLEAATETGGVYSPERAFQRVGQYVDQILARTEAQQARGIPPETPMMGRIRMPGVTQPQQEQVVAQDTVVEATPEGEIAAQATVAEEVPQTAPKSALELIQEALIPSDEVQEPSESSPPPISFKGKETTFFEKARSHDTYKDWSDEDLRAAYENHQKLSAGRFRLDRTSSSFSAQPASREETKQILSYALNEDLFFQGVKPSEAENITQFTLETLGEKDLGDVLSQIRSRKDLDSAVEYILSKEARESFKELPEETAVGVNQTLTDTLVVGGVQGVFSALDQLPVTSGVIYASTLVPGAGPVIASVAAGVNVAGGAYRFWKNMRDDRYFTAFFTEPKTATQKQRFYERRYQFAERYRDMFTESERESIRRGNMDRDLSLKVANKIQEQGFFLNALDLIFRPVSKLDDATFHLADRVKEAHPNANPSAVLALDLFGSLSGGRATYSGFRSLSSPKTQVRLLSPKNPSQRVHKVPESKVTILTESGEEIKVSPPNKETLNSTRQKLVKEYQFPDDSPSQSQKAYNEYWARWAKSLGKEPYEPFAQRNKTWLAIRPYAGLAGFSSVYGGVDYFLDEALEEPYFLRLLANVGAHAGGHALNLHYYQLKNQANARNLEGKREMFRQFTEDFRGTTTDNGKNTVFDIPVAKKQITLSPEGTVLSKPSPTPPTNLPEGPLTLKEFTDVQSPNFMSLYGLTENLGLGLPDFTRTPPSKTVSVDTQAVQRYVEDSWKTKRNLIEKAREQDLSPFLDPGVVKNILGESQANQVPQTNDLKRIAKALYDQIPQAHEGPLPVESLEKLKAGVEQIIDYFSEHPTLGLSFGKEKALLTDVARGAFRKGATVADLVDFHQKINTTKYDLRTALRKEYSIENRTLYEFYTALGYWVSEAFPQPSREILRQADNAYFAYKYSEAVDDFLASQRDIQFDEWYKKKNLFKKTAEDLFETFQDGEVANAIRKSLVHDDYIRTHLRAPNVELTTEGRIIRQANAIEGPHELRGTEDALVKATYQTHLGKPARLLYNIWSNVKNIGTYNIQRMGARAMQSTPFILAPDLQPLVDASNQAHNLRVIRSPISRRMTEIPEIVKDIQSFAEKRAKTAEMQTQAEEKSFRQQINEQRKALEAKLKSQAKEASQAIKEREKAANQRIRERETEKIRELKEREKALKTRLEATEKNFKTKLKALSDELKSKKKTLDEKLQFKNKQALAKQQFQVLGRERQRVIRLLIAARKEKGSSYFRSLENLLKEIHRRITNLRPYIDDMTIKKFDSEHSLAEDFIKRLND